MRLKQVGTPGRHLWRGVEAGSMDLVIPRVRQD